MKTEALWRALSRDLHRYVARRAPPADVDDLVQDVLERAYAARDSLRDDLPLEPWLFTIARNVVIDHQRRRRPIVRTDTTHADPTDAERVRIDFEFSALREAVGGWLGHCVATLPEPYRQAVHRVDVLGERQVDVAADLGLSYSSLKSRVQRGRARIRDRFLDCCHVELDRRGTITGITPRPPNRADHDERDEPCCDPSGAD